MKIKQVNVITCQEWDRVVTETYGRPYCVQQQEGCRDRGTLDIQVPNEHPDDFPNDTIVEKVNGPEMGVSFAAWLARDPKQKLPDREEDYCLELWWDRNFYPSLEMVANDLHAKGILPAGRHTIMIDW